MPIYTYRCENCGVQFEKQQSFTDASLKVCPECKHKTLRKVYQPVGIVFKGSGFYATDHRSPSGTGRPGSKSEDSRSADNKAEKESRAEKSESADKKAEKESKAEMSVKSEKSGSSSAKEE